MPPRYIRHLTLDTGDQRDSYRNEVGEEAIALLGPLLQRVAAGERVEIPGDVEPRCTMTGATGRGRALLVTVWGPPFDAAGIRAPNGVPLVTFGLAPSSLASATLWREWIGTERDDRTPSAPWCAVRLLAGLTIYPSAAKWLGDIERCCAWAWLEGTP